MPAAGVSLSVSVSECFFVVCQLFSSPCVFCCARYCRSIRCGTLMMRRRRYQPSIHHSRRVHKSSHPHTGWIPLGCPQMGLKCRSRCFPSPSSSFALSAKYAIHLLDSCSGAASTPRLCIAMETVSAASYVQEVQAKSAAFLRVEQRKSAGSNMETPLSWNSINSHVGKTSETLSGPPQLQEQSSAAEIVREEGREQLPHYILLVFVRIIYIFF